jgi:two-component system CheB/CheR fusion protein
MTEELRASNEELQSINEEYRSTSEELETSKEELQSINEELQTLNNELKLKLDAVSRAHNDLQNLMSATDVAILFLSTSMRINRFTPRLSELFHVMAGSRISRIACNTTSCCETPRGSSRISPPWKRPSRAPMADGS